MSRFKVDLRIDIADFMMNPSILVYRTVQCQSVNATSSLPPLVCPISAATPRPPARPTPARPPPPAFLVLGQRPGSSPGERIKRPSDAPRRPLRRAPRRAPARRGRHGKRTVPTSRRPDRPTARPPDRPIARPPDRPTARPPDRPTARPPDRPTARRQAAHPDHAHAHTQPPHAHARRRAGGWVGLAMGGVRRACACGGCVVRVCVGVVVRCSAVRCGVWRAAVLGV